MCSGVFTSSGVVELNAGQSVPLTARQISGKGLSERYGNIQIDRPGLYYAALTVDIPEYVSADTVIHLELDSQTIVPPELSVRANGDSATANFTGQTVFEAKKGSVLKVSTSREFLSDETPQRPVFTLTVLRLG